MKAINAQRVHSIEMITMMMMMMIMKKTCWYDGE